MYRINIGDNTVASCNGAQGAVTESLILSGGETCRVLGRPDDMTVEKDSEVKSSNTNPSALGVKITYKNGDSCNPSSGQKRQTLIHVECDESMMPSSTSSVSTEQAGELLEMQKIDPCKTAFKMKSYFACANTSSEMSFAKMFCYMFFLFALLYCALGFAYNYKMNNLRGVEAVPNLSFWKDLPALTKEGVVYSTEKTMVVVKKLRSKYGGGNNSEESDPLSGDTGSI
jgi:hypothetical protein